MTNSITFDTNLLIYFVDSVDPVKHHIAKRIVDSCYYARSPLPLQCLGEFYRAATRKKFLTAAAAAQIVTQAQAAMLIVPSSTEDLIEAMQVYQQHNVPFWDAMLCATARRAGCTLLLSEDLQDGREINGLTIRNPFKLSIAELEKLLA